jgi:hypothetical protein
VVTSELWGAPMGKSRGPPPGISNKNTPGSAVTGGGNSGSGSGGGGGNNGSGWASAGGSVGGSAGTASNAAAGGGGSGGVRSASWGIQGATGTWGSTWLLLKNLTPQVRNNHHVLLTIVLTVVEVL